jgi:hypothetical protein
METVTFFIANNLVVELVSLAAEHGLNVFGGERSESVMLLFGGVWIGMEILDLTYFVGPRVPFHTVIP